MAINSKPIIYKSLNPAKAYKLLNTGALVVISTIDESNIPNLAPVAWQCPLNYDPVTKILFVCSTVHKTLKNILQTGMFAVCIPHASQVHLVNDTGGCSGHEVKKIEKFGISTFPSEKFQLSIPEGCIGYIECEQYKSVEDDDVTVIFGKAVYSAVDELAFSDRLITEKTEGKTLHHLGGKVFMIPGDQIINPKNYLQ